MTQLISKPGPIQHFQHYITTILITRPNFLLSSFFFSSHSHAHLPFPFFNNTQQPQLLNEPRTHQHQPDNSLASTPTTSTNFERPLRMILENAPGVTVSSHQSFSSKISGCHSQFVGEIRTDLSIWTLPHTQKKKTQLPL